MEIIIYEGVASMTYKQLVDHLDGHDCENETLDLVDIEGYLEDVIADNMHKKTEIAEIAKKCAHLALYFIDFAKEPGEGAMQ